MERGNRRVQYLITSAVSTTATTAGANFAWPTTVIPKFFNNETGFYLTETGISWLVAIPSLGFMFGSLCSRTTSDRYGRRATFLFSALPMGIGAIMKLLARDTWSICAARFLSGCGMGCIGSVSSIYIAEISDSDIRGSLILSNRSMFSFGGLLVMAIGPFVSYQTINYAFVVLPICYFIACWFIPETPYFHLKQGKVDAARDTLVKLTGIKDEEVLEERLSQMRSDVKKEMTRSGSIKEFVTGKHYRKAIIIVVGIKVTQLMAGLHAIMHYLGPIIQESHSGMKISTAFIIFGVVRFIVGIISSLLVDRLGRRPLLIYSFFGSGVCLFIIGAYFFINAHPSSVNIYSYYSYIPYVGIVLAILSSVLGFESVAYMIPAELFPINIKSVAMTAGNILAGIMHFIAMKSYQQIKDFGGLSAVFWVFATSSLAGAVFSFFFVPETKKKSLREIQIELQGDLYDEGEKLQPETINSGKCASEENELQSLKTKDEV